MGARVIRKTAVSGIPINAHLAFAALRGRAHRLLASPPRIISNNIETALAADYDRKEIERIVRECQVFYKQIYLWRILPRHPGFGKSRLLTVTGLEHLEDAREKGRGAILITAHLGYPHIIPRLLEARGYAVRQMLADREEFKRMHEFQERLEHSSWLRRAIYDKTKVRTESLYPSDIVASLDVRPLVSALGRNEIVMIAGDGLAATQFMRFPLFGKPYPFPTGVVKIALATGATLLPVFAVPAVRSRGIRVDIEPPLLMDPEVGLDINLTQFVNVLRKRLERTPHLWLRWKVPNWFEVADSRAEQANFFWN